MATTHENDTETEAVRMLLRAGRWIWSIHIPAVSVLFALLWSETDQGFLVAWYVSYLLVIFVQQRICAGHLGTVRDPFSARAALGKFNATAVAVAGCWALVACVFFPSEIGRQYLVTLVIGGAALAAVATQHFKVSTLFISLAIALPVLGIRHMLEGTSESLFVGALVWLFLGLLIQLGIQLRGTSLSAIRLQLEREQLLKDLSTRTKDLEEARGRAIEASAAKSRFLAHASHDLRQPLHAIGLFLESLDDEAIDSPSNQRTINRVRRSLRGLSKLFDTLLDVTLLDTGEIDINPERVRMVEVFEQLHSEFAPVAEEYQVDLRTAATRIVIEADPFILRRMLQNLISNAIRNANGGVVLIGCRRRQGKIDIEVLDNGAGISASDQAIIFDEFTRLASDRSGTAAPGMGLGLAIVARLAGMLGQQVGVKSTIGSGSVFCLRGFEEAAAQPSGTPRFSRDVRLGDDLSAFEVWVFDNDQETLAATVSLLRKWGCKVYGSHSPALDSAGKPDLVMCDFEFTPEASGFDVVEQCRHRFGADLAAIMISGNTSLELRARSKAMGLPLLAKPVLPARLRSALLAVVYDKETVTDRDARRSGTRRHL